MQSRFAKLVMLYMLAWMGKTMIIIFISQLFLGKQWWGEFNAVQICQAGNAVHVGMDGE